MLKRNYLRYEMSYNIFTTFKSNSFQTEKSKNFKALHQCYMYAYVTNKKNDSRCD